MARAYLVNWAAGLGRFCYYPCGGDPLLPMVRSDDATLTAAGVAYREVARWMISRVMESSTVDLRGTYLVTLRAADGTRSRVAWNVAKSVPLSLPPAWGGDWAQRSGGDHLTGRCPSR